ncbi:MAG: CHAD domain-containing protein [Hyphomonadaceae bacterium]
MRSPAAGFDLRTALTEEIQGAMDELDAPHIGPKRVHRCRVRLKRARALARVGAACAPGLSSVFNDGARGVMHMLAEARNLAALAEAARSASETAERRQAAALGAVADALDLRRKTLPLPDLERIKADLRDLRALAQVWPEASPRQIEKGAERIARRARRARRRGLGSERIERRHHWRKRAKDELFAASLLGRDWPEQPRHRKKSEKLGDVLGREHDLLVLIERLDQEPALAGSGKAVTRARRAVQQKRVALKRRANKIGRSLT